MFGLLVLFLTAIAFFVCSQLLNTPIEAPKLLGLINAERWNFFLSLRLAILDIFVIALALAWCAFTACSNIAEFFGYWVMGIPELVLHRQQ